MRLSESDPEKLPEKIAPAEVTNGKLLMMRSAL
jgi:hypothetical protein